MADEKTTFRNIINRSITDFGNSRIAKVGKHAFHKCISLVKVDSIPNVTSIEEKAFKDCSALKEVKVDTYNCSLADDSFDGCDVLESLYVPKGNYNSYKTADNWKYKTPILRGYPYPTEISLEFSGLPYAEDKDINLNGTVTYIDESTEEKSYSGWTAPGIQNFSYNENNNLPIFKEDVCNVNNTLNADGYVDGDAKYIVDFQSESIRKYCFYENTALEFAAFYNIKSIGENAFYGCSNLKKLYLGYNGVVTLTAASDLPNNVEIYVPSDKVSSYKNSSIWSSRADKIFGYDSTNYAKYIKRGIVSTQSVGSAPNVNLIIVDNNSAESTVTPTICIPSEWSVAGDQSLDAFYNVGFRFVKLHIDNVKVE